MRPRHLSLSDFYRLGGWARSRGRDGPCNRPFTRPTRNGHLDRLDCIEDRSRVRTGGGLVLETVGVVPGSAPKVSRGVSNSPLVAVLRRIHEAVAPLAGGAVAHYIPELGRADPAAFGIAIATVDGEVFSTGDASLPFTIQSISKPFVYGSALATHGTDAVHRRVGVEPSGDAFNSILVDQRTNRPFNPMVNAGAIVTTGLVPGDDVASRLAALRTTLSDFAGRDLDVDERVWMSERGTGDRNRALAWLMRSLGMLGADVETTLDAYFGQCSVLVTCRDLAVMAATLANGGTNPCTGRRALGAEPVADVLSVMTTCGMYDYSGEWVHHVGLPAKSGVAGGVLAVLPGHFGIGVFSPPLDERGNSVRGIEVCKRLSYELQLHLLRTTPATRSVVRRTVRGDEIRSNRVRTITDDEELADRRRAIVVHELQGDLFFASAEKVHRTVASALDGAEYVILDLKHVHTIDGPASDVIDALAAELVGTGRRLLVSYASRMEEVSLSLVDSIAMFADTDAALEWCEDELLGAGTGPAAVASLDAGLGAFDVLRGLSAAERAALGAVLETRRFAGNTYVFHEGDAADAMFFLLSGRVSVRIELGELPNESTRRLSSFGPGVTFGEMALLDEGLRSADVVCLEPSTVARLSLGALRDLEAAHPALTKTIYVNLGRLLANRLRAANAQIRALER